MDMGISRENIRSVTIEFQVDAVMERNREEWNNLVNIPWLNWDGKRHLHGSGQSILIKVYLASDLAEARSLIPDDISSLCGWQRERSGGEFSPAPGGSVLCYSVTIG